MKQKNTQDKKRREKKKLTKTVIDNLKTDKKSGEIFYDKDMARFGIKVFPSGKKSFIYDYGRGKSRRRITVGAYGVLSPKEARNKAKKIAGQVLDGHDPLEARQTRDKNTTFGDWIDEYLERVKRRKKQPREDIRYLGRAKKELGKRKLSDIKKPHIEKLFNKYIDDGKTTTANRFLASVRACLQAAWRDDLIESNPIMKIKSLSEPAARSRILSKDEYQRLEMAVNNLTNPYTKAAFKLLMNTGARLSEVLNAKWEDINFENELWVIPSPKSGKRQTMPLSESMVKMLRELPRAGAHVIWGQKPGKSNKKNPDSNQPRADLKRPWANIKKEAKLNNVTIHDIRRTFGLQITKQNGLHVASKLLRHSDIRVTERHYAPLEAEELRRALENRESSQNQDADSSE